MTRRNRRLSLIAAALAVIGCAVGLGLYAMRDSLALFLTPT
ncbi:MAG: cytochrome c biogenesis protein CcmE, partial [Caulobacteraceae bacterium]|nr:cytochrome c biogenesis protein CcmE [Caulobacteraceae bacterium]